MLVKTVFALAAAVAVSANAVSKRATTCTGGQVTAHAKCCQWFDVMADLKANLFDGGVCGDESHASLRLAFHDAIAFSPELFEQGQFGGGGADGSIIAHSNVEVGFHANVGLGGIVELQRGFAIKHGVSFADMIQFAAAVSLSNCAGGPKVQFLAGRANHSRAAPNFLVPEPFDSVDKILARMGDAGFSHSEVVDLLTSHTVAGADDVDPTIPGTPFDSTPSTFDTQVFIEVLLKGVLFPGNGSNQGEVMSPLGGEFRLQSDFLIARDPRTACTWQSKTNNHALMVSKFEAAMAKLAVVGQSAKDLTDCSDVIPVAPQLTTSPSLPAGKTLADIEAACSATPFPTITTAPGPPTTVAPIPQS